jgi:PhnB protein
MKTNSTQTTIEPYLCFNGNCEQAVAFYRAALDATVEMTMRYAESPEPLPPGMVPADWGDKIMHTSFRVGGSRLMASDACGATTGFNGFSLSVAVTTEAEARRYFDALAAGGTITMPLTRTFWSPCFGMVTDRFGLSWMVCVTVPAAP